MILDRTKAPVIQDAVDFNVQLKPYEGFKLDNATPVYTINAGAEEVVMLELVFFAGNWYEDKNIVAATTNHLLKNGTKNKTAFAINEFFEFYGAFLSRSCFNETATITLHCLNKHLSTLLPVVTELITDAIFPESELAIYKQNQKQRLSVNLKKCDFVAILTENILQQMISTC
jgi:predicted Zn-dependent peptidase